MDNKIRAEFEKWTPDCGCRFEDETSNTVILCEQCSKEPAHNKRAPQENNNERQD